MTENINTILWEVWMGVESGQVPGRPREGSCKEAQCCFKIGKLKETVERDSFHWVFPVINFHQ